METSGHGASGRERLLAAALDLFLEAGYDGVSMQQIAGAAEMTKGAPYHYFNNKEDLFAQALARHLERIHAGLIGRLNEASTLRDRMIESFCYLIEHSDPGMLRLVDDLRRQVGNEQMARYGVTLTRLQDFNLRLFEAAVESGLSLRCSPAQAADLFLAVQLGELSLLERETELDITRDHIRLRACQTIDALLEGLLSRGSSQPASDPPEPAPVQPVGPSPWPDRC
ncbi:MAG: TetR/AcrR family transcriptional regulator [Thermomicrobiales bacterium]